MKRSAALALALAALTTTLLAGWVLLPDMAASAQQTALPPLVTAGDAAPRPWKRDPTWPQRDESRFNTLANRHLSPPAPQAPRALRTPISGDPANGQKLVADRSRGGSCLACHVMGQAGDADLPGNVGPDLSEIGNAGRDEAWLFNYVYDARVYNPDTVMPPWGTNGLFDDAEISDIVAFLKTLTKPAVFKSALDDPSRRPPPAEKRANLDALENPGMWAIDKAPALWTARGPTGSSCSTCHTKPEETFKTWASYAALGTPARPGAWC
ncbi:MAG: sulfur oxidation c-type cytochrome SoxX [Bradyrhizobiaceae bacterium]|nr:sulfur oxidation c-type cytochrome SoxX [Bradyrhizobiaceae bacterium]